MLHAKTLHDSACVLGGHCGMRDDVVNLSSAQLCVANRAVRVLGPDDWPVRGECFRGATLPAEHRGFYTSGKKYRVPG
jgi:hypothetical protein